MGFPRFCGHRLGGYKRECRGSDELLLVVDRAELPNRCMATFAVVVTLNPERQIAL
jgi:hypothetical protein